MNYLSVEELTKTFGVRVLFKDLTFGIDKGQKVALIAKNGTGKSTLLKILSGQEQYDSGKVTFRKDIKVGILQQSPNYDDELTVSETIFSSKTPTIQVILEYEQAVLHPEDNERMQQAFEQMDLHEAWDYEIKIKQILGQLAIHDLSQKIGTLSGGQQKRIALAQVLIEEPDLLILDEPTNHLDIDMIEWLENYLSKENMTILMVTHDRYFLERVCDEILELDEGKIYKYKGNYSYYLEKKEERLQIEQTTVQKDKKLYKKELDWMRRQPKARTTKSKSRIDDFFEIKQRAHQRRKDHKVQLEINMERLGSKILELHKLQKSFDDKVILDGFDYVFKRGERIGIIGKNGTGKSSFLNIITQNIPVDGGNVVVGETIKFGYYTQKGIIIKEGQKVIEVVKEIGHGSGHNFGGGRTLEKSEGLITKIKFYE